MSIILFDLPGVSCSQCNASAVLVSVLYGSPVAVNRETTCCSAMSTDWVSIATVFMGDSNELMVEREWWWTAMSFTKTKLCKWFVVNHVYLNVDSKNIVLFKIKFENFRIFGFVRLIRDKNFVFWPLRWNFAHLCTSTYPKNGFVDHNNPMEVSNFCLS